jgi:hypothetical protein
MKHFIIVFLIFSGSFGLAQTPQTCSVREELMSANDRNCNFMDDVKAQSACFGEFSKQADKDISDLLTLFTNNQKRAIEAAKKNGNLVSAEGISKRILRIRVSQQNWEIYRKLQCQVENGIPRKWGSNDPNIIFASCLYRLDLHRFIELCDLTERSEDP